MTIERLYIENETVNVDFKIIDENTGEGIGGLSPTVNIYDSDSIKVVDEQLMTEQPETGLYRYVWTPTKADTFVAICREPVYDIADREIYPVKTISDLILPKNIDLIKKKVRRRTRFDENQLGDTDIYEEIKDAIDWFEHYSQITYSVGSSKFDDNIVADYTAWRCVVAVNGPGLKNITINKVKIMLGDEYNMFYYQAQKNIDERYKCFTKLLKSTYDIRDHKITKETLNKGGITIE